MRGRSSNDRRPSSAGATRSRGSFGFARHTNGNSNIGQNNSQGSGAGMAGLMGHGYAAHVNSNGSQQQQQQHRPSSAGHTRPTVASQAHQHHNHHHLQQHYQYQQQQQPSIANAIYTPQSLSQGQPIAQLLNSHNIPTTTTTAPTAAAATVAGTSGPSTGYARPKSAGSVRRPAADTHNQHNQHNYPVAVNMAHIYGSNGGGDGGANVAQQQYQRYAQQQQQQQVRLNPTADPHVQLNHYTLSSTAMAMNAQQQHQQQQQTTASARPLSASATAHTTQSRHYAAAAGNEHWTANYKLNYGYSAAQAAAAAGSTPAATGGAVTPSTQAPQLQANYKPTGSTEKSLSRPSSKLRNAVDLSHKIGATAAGAATLAQQDMEAGVDNDVAAGDEGDEEEEGNGGDEVMGLDAQRPQTAGGTQMGLNHHFRRLQRNNGATTTGAATAAATGGGGNEEEAEEMDGKPVDQSRSHPEVSMTTPSASMELAHASSSMHQQQHNSSGVDARNSSFDSLTDDNNIQLGLSTVPNQFCTKRDAVDLRKLISLSAGTRGGIVPSSSAVMDMYMVGKVVGVGSYGKVRAAWHRLTSAKVAIKTYDKSKMKDPAHWKRVHSEIKIMEQLSHPRIARMYEAVETPKRMHLIMECLDGGNLCSYVKAKRRLSEEESKRIFFQILQSIDYLHALGVSHRDVKLENVLFANEKEIKLIDFGFSTVCQPGKRLKVFCGTPSYMAPEIVRRSEYEGKPVDMWSMGILLYALLCGCFPFRAKAYPDLYRRIARGTFAMPEELSAPVKDLLKQLLTVDANTRITAHAALRHSWLQSQLVNAPNIDKMRLESPILISEKPADDLDDQVIDELEKFGMPRDEIVRLVLTKTHSSLATLYYLLLNLLVLRRRAAVKSGQLSGANGGSKQHHNHLLRHKSHSSNAINVAVATTASGAAAKVRDSPALSTGAAVGSGAAAVAHYRNASSSSSNSSRPQYDTAGGQYQAMTQQQQEELLVQQAAAEQLAIQHHQQHMIEQQHQQQRLRPKSASQTRSSGQRPLSASALQR